MNSNFHCVIMAGGIGTRFWPLSKASHPKQFIDILGTGKTLIQQTVDRMSNLVPYENIWIVTSFEHRHLVIDQLPGIKPENILCEPVRRNTAPCIAYACYKIKKINPYAIVIAAPSDHLILKEQEFLKVMNKGLQYAAENEALLTLGIEPSRIETGYGYIQINRETLHASKTEIYKVKTFTEKPNYDLAKFFFESGEFYWNSGIFIWSVKAIEKAFGQFLPETDQLFKDHFDLFNTPGEKDAIYNIYSQCKSISIDYGIMEKAQNVFVLCADFGWSDLGTWGSLYEHSRKDNFRNANHGQKILTYNTSGSIINVDDNTLAVIEGLKDYIVVQSGNVLLICRKNEEQQLRQIVNDVKQIYGNDFV